ncbi:hypothetical protein ZIOFF_001433 [Zingiber officinale]|uniref:Protein kinase domain-containing protein n=1 Tax=Zingiber officinale TaxID=94328 RepID=A0A8J5I5T1_ZINOF|nr:hypothetical protein ZIOFF_001433 [Zingiber officinale]
MAAVLSGDARAVGGIEEKYMLDRELCRREFGVTYLCLDHFTEELLACKSISKRKLQTAVDVEDVRREVVIMRHLPRNSNIMNLWEACEDDRVVHCVMELCEGGELFDRIVARGHYSERAAAVVMKTIVEDVFMIRELLPQFLVLELAATWFRSHGVWLFVLREVLPEDPRHFELRRYGCGHIDLILCGTIYASERFSEIVGSPYYMALEVLKWNYGPEIDIWSAGVILYILLCGVPPFWAETEQGVAQAILRGVIDFKREPWPSISNSAKNLVQLMLEPDPMLRLTAKQGIVPTICKYSLSPLGVHTEHLGTDVAEGNLAGIYYDQSQLDMAILHYKQAINCDSTFIEAYNNLTAADGLVNRGNTFKEIGRVTEAIQDYIRAVNIRPTMPEAHANLALAYKDSLQISSTPELKLMKCGSSGLNAC